MGKIVAIGGGDVGRHGTSYETGAIDREIVRLSGRERPHFLFIGIAKRNADGYFSTMRDIYGGMYGCETDILTAAEHEDPDVASAKIGWADIIYVGGGNTLRLMNKWRACGTDALLRRAYEDGKVLCGVSAGGICWCDYGNSDSRTDRAGAKCIKVRGLGLLPVLFCPHIATQERRAADLQRMMKRTYGIPAVAIDRAALEVTDGMYRIIPIDGSAVALKCFWLGGEYVCEDIMCDEPRPLDSILCK